MYFSACVSSSFALLVTAAFANTEKAIFIAPPPTIMTDAQPGLADLNLHSLSPHDPSLSLPLSVAFPTEHQPRGLDSWYLLQRLKEGQRYELRICWAAIVGLRLLSCAGARLC